MLRRRPQARPKKLPIDLAQVETAGGAWLLVIETIVETQGTANLLVGITLEQNINDESFRMRKLEVILESREAHDPEACSDLLIRIAKWMDTTKGDGYLDLTQPSPWPHVS